MKPQYEPKKRIQFYGYLVEEAGEVLAAIGKIMRWGEMSCNPEIPEAERESNLDWLRREIRDLRGAADRLEKYLDEAYPPTDIGDLDGSADAGS